MLSHYYQSTQHHHPSEVIASDTESFIHGQHCYLQSSDVSPSCDTAVIPNKFFQYILQDYPLVSQDVTQCAFSNLGIGIHWGQRTATRFPAGYSTHQLLPVCLPPVAQSEHGREQHGS